MSLRIRRGTDAQRQAVLFDQGEIIYTTDTQKLYVGDGSTTGGNNVGAALAGTGLVWNALSQTLQATTGGGLSAVVGDTAPQLGGNLTLNGHNISGTGSVNITGSITATGSIIATTGLGADLPLNGHNITGTGGINITGNIQNTGTLNTTTSITTPSINSALINVPDSSNGMQLNSLIGNGVAANFYAGSSASPTTIGTGPGNGMTFALKGWNGTAYIQSGVIDAFFEPGANLTDTQPKSTILLVSGGGGSKTNYAGLNSVGAWVAPTLMAAGPNYATGGASGYNGSGSYPSPAVAGMIIFDNSNSHFYGYNGTTWKQLDN